MDNTLCQANVKQKRADLLNRSLSQNVRCLFQENAVYWIPIYEKEKGRV